MGREVQRLAIRWPARPTTRRCSIGNSKQWHCLLLCLLLAVREQEDRQTALGQIAEKLVTIFSADADLADTGIAFDLSSMDQRRDMVQVVRQLLHLGVVRRRHGDEEQY